MLVQRGSGHRELIAFAWRNTEVKQLMCKTPYKYAAPLPVPQVKTVPTALSTSDSSGLASTSTTLCVVPGGVFPITSSSASSKPLCADTGDVATNPLLPNVGVACETVVREAIALHSRDSSAVAGGPNEKRALKVDSSGAAITNIVKAKKTS